MSHLQRRFTALIALLLLGSIPWLTQACWGPGKTVGSACEKDYDCQEDSICEGDICILINGVTTDAAPQDTTPQDTPQESAPEIAISEETRAPEQPARDTNVQETAPDPPACANSPRIGQACTVGTGPCMGTGQWVCQNNGSLACNGVDDPSKQSPETCNGIDDDCNGQIDDLANPQRSCYTGAVGTQGKGPCKAGTQTCTGGQWGTCTGEVTPQTETCNGTDDDCDGTTDGANLCPAEQECKAGKCVAICSAPNRVCGGACTDVKTDKNNCGSCGNICQGNLECCDGACVDVNSSEQHCGKCGSLCPLDCCTGVCTDLDQDNNNCGRCGNVCQAGTTCNGTRGCR